MGELIIMSEHRRAKAASRRAGVVFAFDLASPHTYLAAERVDRLFASAQWCPVITDLPPVPAAYADTELRAAALRLPLVWPEKQFAAVAARRIAAYASSIGQGAAFVLAASRLAFCGGFDLDDPEILAEAAAAAYLPFEDCLEAATDKSLDIPMATAGLDLVMRGAERLPVLQVGHMLFCGEERIAEAAAASRATAPSGGQAFKPA